MAARALFASISSAAAPRPAVQGPGQALRLHAEELRAAREAAEQRARQSAQQEADQQQKQRQQIEAERRATERQERRRIIVHEGVNHVKHMMAGALAACVSRTAVAPFERVKMECMVRQKGVAAFRVASSIFQQEGVSGFWLYNGLNILRTAPYKAVNFSSYDAYRKLMQKSSSTAELGRGGTFVAGALAGITAMLTCFPLDVVRTRILAAGQLKGYANPFRVMRDVYSVEGLAGLYAGCLPALISVAPSGAVFYGTYDLLKDWHLAHNRARGRPSKTLSTGFTLLYGGVAGVAAETAVYPLQIVQRHMQQHAGELSAAAALKLTHMPGPMLPFARSLFRFWGATAAVYRAHGLMGFYAGTLPNIMQVLPNAALSYYAYEAFKVLLKAED